MALTTTAPPDVTPHAPRDSSRVTAWGFTGLLVGLYVINWADKAVFGLAAQPLAEDLGLSASQIGLVGSAFFLAFTIGGFLAGLLNRWFALRWSLALLAIGWAVAMFPLVISGTFTVLLLSRMLLGFLEGPSSALVHTAVYSWHPPAKRAVPSACITACASVSKFAIAPLLALLMVRHGWQSAFVLLAAVGLLWTLVWLPTWRVGPYGSDKSTATSVGSEVDQPQVPWVKVLTSKTFVAASLAVMPMYALVSVILTWLPSYLELGLGYSRVRAGVIFGFPSIAALVVMALLTPVADRLIGRGTSARLVRGVVPGVLLLVCGLAMALLPYISTPVIAVAVITIGYGFGASIFPLINAGLSQIVGPRQLAGTLGIFLAIQSIGGLVSPYVTGLIVAASASAAEGYGRSFQLFGVLAVLGAVAAMALIDPDRDRTRLLGATH
ncbi:MFS transporter [Kribbia dieselivorans]|uniref:MFS transporter n=1 Tax=Kribbia dieselivorans TaxID=331526 RepID=UPI0008398571|nr:MFS transporter [Kribbia dieselivorans]